ncbi:ribosomal protein L17 [Umbelopsis sp. PMI_123]|nr:ribosomal protein L17 [Umbelopsis sp. PMI_123]
MHHGKHVRRLNRTSAHRKAMFRNMVSALIKHERIETTLPKAKELKKIADKMITIGKKGDFNAKRSAMAYLREHGTTIPILFDTLAPRFANRNGGYTRIQRIGQRYGDNAPMAVIEYIDGKNDLKKELVMKQIARAISPASGKPIPNMSVEDILAGKGEVLGGKKLQRDIKKLQASPHSATLKTDIEAELAKVSEQMSSAKL